jgi:hypothetical protein
VTWPASVFWIFSGGRYLSVSSEQHASSGSIDVALSSIEAQNDCPKWSAQLAMQPSDKQSTLNASANARNLFDMLRRHLIGGIITNFSLGANVR